MPFALNLKTKAIGPLVNLPNVDPKEFLNDHTIVVSNAQAEAFSKAKPEEREKMVASILGKRLLNDPAMSAEHRKILMAGLNALGLNELSDLEKKDKAEPEVETPEADTIAVTVDTGESAAVWTEDQIRYCKKQASLLAYANNTLGLKVPENTQFDILKNMVLEYSGYKQTNPKK